MASRASGSRSQPGRTKATTLHFDDRHVMRWKLLRRRWSIAAPRVIVRRHLPWPLRWAVAALVLGFSAAIALWAFEFGKEIAGLDRQAKDELVRLRAESGRLQDEKSKAEALAHTADSLLRAERVAQDRLTQQVRQLETENMALKSDLAFFERLLPPSEAEGLSIRSLQLQPQGPGEFRYEVLVMQSGKTLTEFKGRLELTLAGTLDGKAWALPPDRNSPALSLLRYGRAEGLVQVPRTAVVKTAQVRIIDAAGVVRATHTARQ